MSEPKFTPGPWIFGTKGDWTISSAAHSGSLMGNASYYPWVPENKADWYLIAAAPALYKALERIDAFIDDEFMDAAVFSEIIYNALAKARGEG